MANTKETVGGRVEPEKREWIEEEAKRRDRSISYIVNELITDAIERREGARGGDEDAAPAVV